MATTPRNRAEEQAAADAAAAAQDTTEDEELTENDSPSTEAEKPAPIVASEEDQIKNRLEATEREIANTKYIVDALIKTGAAENAPVALKTQQDQLAILERRKTGYENDLENRKRIAAAAATLNPVLEVLNKQSFPSNISGLMNGQTVVFADLDKDLNDVEQSALKLAARSAALKAAKAAVTEVGLTEEQIHDLPSVTVDFNGNVIKFAAAGRKLGRSTAGSGVRTAGTGRTGITSRGASKIVACEQMPELVGVIVGKHTDAKYASWQALFDDLAPQSEKDRLKDQNRNMREWAQRKLGVQDEPIEVAVA